ncbi:MAG: GspH/FimT family pseudopilin [Desulfobacterales bacterium]|nr:GspH/FimT family pseudopilin [Desulfobacterales bacterium]
MIKLLKSNNGFTLIEVMIVISILGIIAGVGGAGLNRWLPDYRLKSSVLDIRSMIQSARLEAVKNNADVFIRFDSNTRVCSSFLDNATDAPNRGILDGGDNPVMNLAMPAGIVIIDLFGVVAPVVDVTINSRGFSTLAGEIHLKNARDTYQGVNLTLAGSSRIIRSADGGVSWN